ncbi:MAG: hypothetical protein JSS81_07270 [Acidobacteria bacterium]|nr:hypothetical protein [Acidobacteriota bacterium]
MPCETVKIGDSYAIVCSRGRRRKTCLYCSREHEFLCDFPVGKTKGGKTKTCDRPLCRKHSLKGVSEGVDFCREHYPIAKAAYERRMAAFKND